MSKEENKNTEKEKCFVIMPISDDAKYPKGHFTKVYEQIIRPAVEGAGYIAYRVDENKISDSIIDKIFDAIQNCPMAICDLSSKNPNVLYELGLRQAFDKPVVLIRDDQTDSIFDISGISTVYYKSGRLYEDVLIAQEEIRNAILETKDGQKKTLVKVVKAKSADFGSVEVSNEDKTQIMLNEIKQQISELKRSQTRSIFIDYSNAEDAKKEQAERIRYGFTPVLETDSRHLDFKKICTINKQDSEKEEN